MGGPAGACGNALLLTARFAGTGATTICFQAVSEAFPARLRGSCFGFANSAGRLGTTAAPFIVHLMPSDASSAAALAALAGTGALCALAIQFIGQRPGAEA